jgi:hypothetical protein
VFSVKFPEPSLFQTSELLRFIEFCKKFIKITKSVLFESLGQSLQVVCCDFELKVLICGLGYIFGNECFICILCDMHVL